MKKLLMSLVLLSFSLTDHAQIGINTVQPQGIFHVDGSGNTIDNTNLGDDVIISKDGNWGIGVLPTTDSKISLSDGGTVTQVNPVLQLQDGNEGINKVLISDADGNATWVEYTNFGLTLGQFGNGVNISASPTYTSESPYVVSRGNNIFVKTTGQITLAPGLWFVRCSMLMTTIANPLEGVQVWMRTTLADDISITRTYSSSAQRSDDVNAQNGLASSMIWCNGLGGVINGSFTLNNTSGTNKTYHLVIGWIDRFAAGSTTASMVQTVFNCGSSTDRENSLFAYRLD